MRSTTDKLDPGPTENKRRRRSRRVYLSCPVLLLGTDRYAAAATLLRNRFAGAVLLLPDQLFDNRDDWLARWHPVSRGLTDLVILTDVAGYIGRGGYDEIQTARRDGAAIWLLTEAGTLVPSDQLVFGTPNSADWRRYVRVTVPGGDRAP